MTDITSFVFPAPRPGFDVSNVSYVHDQGVPLASWTIPHNLGYHPNFIILDSGGNEVGGEPTYISVDILQVDFKYAFGGKAYLT